MDYINFILKKRNLDKNSNYLLEFVKKYGHSYRSARFSICIITIPCGGFGDIIFSIKLFKFLKRLYKSANIKIITDEPEKFHNAYPDVKTISASSKQYINEEDRCLNASRLSRKNKKELFDVYFVAPAISAEPNNIKQVASLFKNADIYNTYFITEYNADIQDISPRSNILQTGLGGRREGIMIDNVSIPRRNIKLPNQYALAYVADFDDGKCLKNFFKMLLKRYDVFDLVVPENALEYSFFEGYNLVDKKGKAKRGVINIRGDVLPVKQNEMVGLMYHSLPDILVTGDQSLSDVISCCSSKELWYQKAPWKSNLGNALGKEVDSRYGKQSTTCGYARSKSLRKGVLKQLSEDWNFYDLSKRDIDAFITTALLSQDREVAEVNYIIKSSKNIHKRLKELSL